MIDIRFIASQYSFIALISYCVSFLWQVCLPYVPASSEQVKNVLQALQSSRGKTLLDLGSGDGRLVSVNNKCLFGKICTIIKINTFGTKIQVVLHQAVTASAKHSIK